MKRLGLLIALLVVGIVAIAFVALPTRAQEIPPHGHILILSPEVGLIDGVPHLVGIKKCVDLAANQALPLKSHHEHIHFGDTGVSFGGEAGHAVAPTAPYGPWAHSPAFEATIPFPLQ